MILRIIRFTLVALFLVSKHYHMVDAKLECEENDIECHEKSKYTKEQNEPSKWQKYVTLIENAMKNYKNCEFQNCSCYKR